LRPLPKVWKWGGGKANDWDALVWDGGGVCVLVAHDDEGGSVDGKSVLELRETKLKIRDLLVNNVEVKSVSIDLGSVVIDIRGVLVNIRFVLLNVSLEMGDSLLEGGDGLTNGFGGDEHVSSGSNHKLVSVLSKGGSHGVEGVDSGVKVWGVGDGWDGWHGSTVVHVLGVGVVVGAIWIVGILMEVLVLRSIGMGLDGD